MAGCLVTAGSVVVSPGNSPSAAAQAWSPFVLVTGLLLIGLVAHDDGLFDAAAAVLNDLPGGSSLLLLVLLGVVALVTVLLNLDTSVAFLTPVLILSARRRGYAEEPFLYGALFMSNSASLLLPGSNLTNLLVLEREHISGAMFAARMLPAWIAAVATTAVVMLVLNRGTRATPPTDRENRGPGPGVEGIGVLAVAAAAILVVGLRRPALPVLALGVAAVCLRLAQGRLTWRRVGEGVDPAVLVGLFGIAVGLGTLARSWDGPGELLRAAGGWETAAVGAIAAIVANNLPAAVLFTARRPPHPRALLLGLNLGPNLAVTGSLSALLWFRAARTVGSEPSAARLSRIGIALVPLSIVAGGLALQAFAPQHL